MQSELQECLFNVAPLKKVLRVSEFTYQPALKILGGWGDSYNKISLEQGNPNWPAEVGALLHAAQWAQGVLEVTINIYTGNT